MWMNLYCEYIFEQANDLQPRDFSGTADPYAKIRLLPDKTNFWQTKIHKRTLNPSMLLKRSNHFVCVVIYSWYFVYIIFPYPKKNSF